MARIPESEIERLKSEVAIERLVEASGVVLKKSGKDKLGRCPFHEDETASLVVTPANEQERAQVETLARDVQAVCGQSVQIAFVDQGYTGENAANAAKQHGVCLEVVKHTEAKRGFVLLPRRWVVERTFGWLGRFRRLARDYERLAETLREWHWLAALTLLLKNYFSSA